MKTFNVSKAHGWDKISVKMIKIWSKTIAMPLKVIFCKYLEEAVFLDD